MPNTSCEEYSKNAGKYKFQHQLSEVENIVFRGGGIKGLAYVGALKSLEESEVKNGFKRVNIKRVGGSSIGAFTAAAYALGCDSNELDQYMKALQENAPAISKQAMLAANLGLKKDLGETSLDAVKLGYDKLSSVGAMEGSGYYLLCKKMVFERVQNAVDEISNGLEEYSGKINLKDFKKLQDNLASAKLAYPAEIEQAYKYINITFEDLAPLKDSGHFKDLFITGSRINQDGNKPPQMDVFDSDNSKTMEIATALRISASFPGAFKPVVYEGNTYVDGGLMDNMPFNQIPKESGKVLAFDLVSGKRPEFKSETRLVSFIRNSFASLFGLKRGAMQKESDTALQKGISTGNIIHAAIPTKNISSMSLNLAQEGRDFLPNSGKKYTSKALNHRYINGKNLYEFLGKKGKLREDYLNKYSQPRYKTALRGHVFKLIHECHDVDALATLKESIEDKESKVGQVLRHHTQMHLFFQNTHSYSLIKKEFEKKSRELGKGNKVLM